MKSNPLGTSGLSVTQICLGTMTWGVQNDEAEAHAQIDLAADAGINMMDTAEVYAVPTAPETYGRTEEIIGNWFAKTGRRDDWILATKIAGPGTKWVRDGAPATARTIRTAVEDSLRRLQTDYIDLYQLHWPTRSHYHFTYGWTYDPSGDETRAVEAAMLDILQGLDALVGEGKIRHVGLSNETAWGTMRFLQLAREHGLPRMVSVQNEYNLLRRTFDLDLAEVAHHEQVGLLGYSPLASGILSGKYLDGAVPKGSRGDIGSVWRLTDQTKPAIRKYVALADAHGLDASQMAIAFCLTRPLMTSVIVGATSPEQLKTDIGAAELTLSDEVTAGIAAIFKDHARPL